MGGCKAVVLDPSWDVGTQQRDLLLQATGLMLVIIVPVMALTVFFAWRYRHSNTSARYEPDWDHSMQLELVIWGAPLLIIIRSEEHPSELQSLMRNSYAVFCL